MLPEHDIREDYAITHSRFQLRMILGLIRLGTHQDALQNIALPRPIGFISSSPG
jgi:hypothetical protein